MSERTLLAATLQSRSAYDKIKRHVTDDDLGEQGKRVLEAVAEFYNTDPAAEHCEPGIVTRYVTRTLTNPKHKIMFSEIVDELSKLDVSPENVVKDLIAVKQDVAGHKLAAALAQKRPTSEVIPLVAEYEALSTLEGFDEEEKDDILIGAKLDDLIRIKYEGELVPLWPRALNERLGGGLLPGHHVLVFARPEAGKTLFLINMTAGFLNAGKTVLYVGNEDPMADILLRVIGRLSMMDQHAILDDPDKADQLARKRGYENIIFASLAPGTPREIETLVLKFNPDVVIVDQLRNLNVGEEHFVQKLEKAATEMRNIAKRNDVVVISATQAGDSASGKAILEMGDVDSSNTGIPAQVDVMIGIGGTGDDMARDRRIVSLPKNKRTGDHNPFPITVDRLHSRVRSA